MTEDSTSDQGFSGGGGGGGSWIAKMSMAKHEYEVKKEKQKKLLIHSSQGLFLCNPDPTG